MNNLEEVLDIFTLSEILEMSDITEVEVLEILLRHGYIELPPFLQFEEDDELRQE